MAIAVATMFAMGAAPGIAEDDVGDTGFYAEIGGVVSSVSDVDAPFTSDNLNGSYEPSTVYGAKVHLG